MYFKMSKYHEKVYKYFNDLEKKSENSASGSESFKIYVRMACNFVFPKTKNLLGTERPRPSSYGISKDILDESKDNLQQSTDIYNYSTSLLGYINEFGKYMSELMEKDTANKFTITDEFDNIEKYDDEYLGESNVYRELKNCTPKMLFSLYKVYKAKRLVLIYSNFVSAEGIAIMRLLMETCLGMKPIQQGEEYKMYAEYHGGVSEDLRKIVVDIVDSNENKDARNCKCLLISETGAEGLNIKNGECVIILENHWQEVRITQVIGRLIRWKGHCGLPMEEREVHVYRLFMTHETLETADSIVYNTAKLKNETFESIYQPMREIAVNCELNRAHHRIQFPNDTCFRFNETEILRAIVNKENVNYAPFSKNYSSDMIINNGTSDINSKVIFKDAYELNVMDGKREITTLYDPDTHFVYDKDMKFLIGKLQLDTDDLPFFNKDMKPVLEYRIPY